MTGPARAPLLAEVCPGCGSDPGLIISVRQVFCANEECRVVQWDMTRDPVEQFTNARFINMPLDLLTDLDPTETA